DPSVPNEQVTLSATVNPFASGGSVSFFDGGTPIGGCTSKPLDASRRATCAVAYASGTHTITARYSGGGGFYTSSASDPLVQQVAPPTAVGVRSFSARRTGHGVTLAWRAAAEVGLAGFVVSRSGGGRTIQLRGVPARGIVTGRSYRLTDRRARPGV